MTKDELISQNEALVQLVQDSKTGFDWQTSSVFLVVLAIAIFLVKYLFNKVDKSIDATSLRLTEVQKDAAITEYKFKQQDADFDNLKIRNEQATLNLKESLSKVADEQVNTFSILRKIGYKVQANELKIGNLEEQHKFIAEEVRSIKSA